MDKEKELLILYKQRVSDHRQLKWKRQKMIEAHPLRLSDLLTLYFKDDAQALFKIEESRALLAWEEFVGPIAARVATPLRIRERTLMVKVRDPLWMQQLSFLKTELLRKYQKAFPRLKLSNIFFVR